MQGWPVRWRAAGRADALAAVWISPPVIIAKAAASAASLVVGGICPPQVYPAIR